MLRKILNLVHLDFAPRHQQPSGVRVVLATIVSIVGSLAVDALIVVIFQAAFPSTKGYAHYQFSDYSKLTIIGVIIACIAWPIVTRITSEPRWMFLRMAVLVTLVLWLPDVASWSAASPARRWPACSSCTWRSRWSPTTRSCGWRRSARSDPLRAAVRSRSGRNVDLPKRRSRGEPESDSTDIGKPRRRLDRHRDVAPQPHVTGKINMTACGNATTRVLETIPVECHARRAFCRARNRCHPKLT